MPMQASPTGKQRRHFFITAFWQTMEPQKRLCEIKQTCLIGEAKAPRVFLRYELRVATYLCILLFGLYTE